MLSYVPNTPRKTYAPNWSRKNYILAGKTTFFIFSHFLVRKSLRVGACQKAKNEEKIDFEKIFKKYARYDHHRLDLGKGHPKGALASI